MNTDRFNQAIAMMDRANEMDPNTELYEGKTYPRELLYAIRMTDQLTRFEPDAPESVHLAARCQHLERWKISRDAYKMDRQGYLSWRKQLKQYHARRAREILEEVAYPDPMIEEVQVILLKKRLKRNEKVQLLEDVVCLVFLEYYLEAFSKKHNEQKLHDILRKTWAKMSDKGREKALNIDYDPRVSQLLQDALII